MKSLIPMRRTVIVLAFAGAAGVVCFAQAAQQRHAPPPPPPQHAPAQPHGGQQGGAPANARPGKTPNGEHLASWLDHHSNLTPEQQQQELQKEPGFANLPPQTQQRFKDRLNQLDNMSPEQRNRIMARTEAMEKLTPEQRGQVRSAMAPLAMLTPDRRKVVARIFRQYRDTPPQQRGAFLNSPDVHSQLNDSERGVLNGLAGVEGYLPPPAQ